MDALELAWKVKLMRRIVAWLIGFAVVATRWTCRWDVTGDVRGSLREEKTPYIYAAWHAHHAAALLGAEKGATAMLSRSDDGDMMMPALKLCGLNVVRGSAGSARKGGLTALRALIKQVDGEHPACLAIDGPKGPRGVVQEGIGLLAKKTGAVVIPTLLVPSRRWIVTKSWDRLQLPKPFSKIRVVMSPPMSPQENESNAEFALRLQNELTRLELEYDPIEAKAAGMKLPEATEVKQSKAA